MSDVIAKLTEPERDRRWPNRRPVDAATLIVVDESAKKPKVLMGRRRADLAFMPGHYVFPGGRVDRSDGDAPALDALAPDTETRLLRDMKGRPTRRRARALAMTAIRETFEETGVLIGRENDACPITRAADWQAFLDHEVMPLLSGIGFFARAITPPRRPRRFDTRFFVISASNVAKTLPLDERPTDELEDVVWVTLDEAKDLDIPVITEVVLDELAERLNQTGSIGPADVPVPFYYMQRDAFRREIL
ncbi:MAG: NUDIX hydrolase [Pseudomonadota bacterium]